MDPTPRELDTRQVPLSTLFIGMALVAIVLAVMRSSPGWGLTLAVLFIAGGTLALRHLQHEQSWSLADQLWILAQMVCIVAFLAVSVVIVFVAIAAPVVGVLLIALGCIGAEGAVALSLSCLGGMIVGGYVTTIVFWEVLLEC